MLYHACALVAGADLRRGFVAGGSGREIKDLGGNAAQSFKNQAVKTERPGAVCDESAVAVRSERRAGSLR